MNPSHTPDKIDDFTLELLRAGYALTGLATDLAQDDPSDSDDGESRAEAVMQAMSGTIRRYLGEADERDVICATELIAGAVERVIEELKLGLALRQRMNGDGPDGRLYDSPPLDELDLDDLPEAIHIPADSPAIDVPDELAIELLDCGGLLNQMIAQMLEFSQSGRSAPDAPPIPDVVRGLLREVIVDVSELHSESDLSTAVQIVRETVEGMVNDIFFIPPEPE